MHIEVPDCAIHVGPKDIASDRADSGLRCPQLQAQTLNQVQKRIEKGGSTSQVFPPKDKLQEEALIAVKFHILHAYLVISRLLRSSPRHPIPLQLFSSSPHGSPSAQPHPSRIESTRLNSCKALSSCLELLAARSAAAWNGGCWTIPET